MKRCASVRRRRRTGGGRRRGGWQLRRRDAPILFLASLCHRRRIASRGLRSCCELVSGHRTGRCVWLAHLLQLLRHCGYHSTSPLSAPNKNSQVLCAPAFILDLLQRLTSTLSHCYLGRMTDCVRCGETVYAADRAETSEGEDVRLLCKAANVMSRLPGRVQILTALSVVPAAVYHKACFLCELCKCKLNAAILASHSHGSC